VDIETSFRRRDWNIIGGEIDFLSIGEMNMNTGD